MYQCGMCRNGSTYCVHTLYLNNIEFDVSRMKLSNKQMYRHMQDRLAIMHLVNLGKHKFAKVWKMTLQEFLERRNGGRGGYREKRLSFLDVSSRKWWHMEIKMKEVWWSLMVTHRDANHKAIAFVTTPVTSFEKECNRNY